MTDYELIEIVTAPPSDKHKMIAIFKNRRTGTFKSSPFGLRGYEDYTMHKDKDRRAQYRRRHEKDLRTHDPTKPGYLSYYILWGDSTSLAQNIKKFKQRFFHSSSNTKIATRRNEQLWEQVKKDVCPKTWNARCAQLSVKEYKKKYLEKLENKLCTRAHSDECKKKALVQFHQQNQGYIGQKPSIKKNSLRKWTVEDWDYITDENGRYGRYLPRKVRDVMSPELKQKENKRKGHLFGHRIPYSDELKTIMKSMKIF